MFFDAFRRGKMSPDGPDETALWRLQVTVLSLLTSANPKMLEQLAGQPGALVEALAPEVGSSSLREGRTASRSRAQRSAFEAWAGGRHVRSLYAYPRLRDLAGLSVRAAGLSLFSRFARGTALSERAGSHGVGAGVI